MNQFFQMISKDLPQRSRKRLKKSRKYGIKKENTVDPVSNERIYKTNDNQSLSKNNWEYIMNTY